MNTDPKPRDLSLSLLSTMARAVMRNRATAADKRHSYRYRLSCDRSAARAEDALIRYANRIMERNAGD